MARRRRRPAVVLRSARVVRLAVGGVGLALVAGLVVSSGIANAVGDARPGLALAAQPGNARANAHKADQLLLRPGLTAAQLAEAGDSARQALGRDSTLASAWRTLSFVAAQQRNEGLSRALLATAERVSRRDIPTQLALIETQVARGDVVGALRHYDIVLRIEPRNDPVLLPILVAASADPNVRAPLARLVQRAPIWRRRFLTTMTNAGIDADNYADFAVAMRRYGPLVDADIYRNIAGIYANAGRPGAAWRLIRALDGAGRWAAPVRNGSFANGNASPPFDWALADGGDIEAVQGGAAGSGKLTISATRGDAGSAAKQLLALRPGAYQLSFRAGPLADATVPTLYATLTCAVPNGAAVAAAAVQPARPGLVRQSFAVPGQRCEYQWLDIGLRAGRTDAAAGAWITNVAIAPAAAS